MSLFEKLDQLRDIHKQVSPSVKKLLSDPEDPESLAAIDAANEKIEALNIDSKGELLLDIGFLQDLATSAADKRKVLETNPNNEAVKTALKDLEDDFTRVIGIRSYPSEWKDYLNLPVEQPKESLTFVVLKEEMPEAKRRRAEVAARKAVEAKHTNKEIAGCIRDDFTARYGRSWHCVVGSDLGWYGNYAVGTFVHFRLGQKDFILYQTRNK